MWPGLPQVKHVAASSLSAGQFFAVWPVPRHLLHTCSSAPSIGDRDRLRRDRQRLGRDRDRLGRDRDRLGRERDLLERERDLLEREHDLLERERDRLGRERARPEGQSLAICPGIWHL